MGKHWTDKLFIEHEKIFLKYLKQEDKRTSKDIEFLERMFSELNIHTGNRVLDICCGYGRHALSLAEKGFLVTGVDISPLLIKHAKKLAEEMDLKTRIEFLVGDARNILKILEDKQGTYNAIINMWNSIGYYDDQTDKRILNQLHNLSSPNGIIIIEFTNRDFVIKHFNSFRTEIFEDFELHEHRKWFLESSRIENTWKFYQKEGDTLKHLATIPINHRIYSLHELIEILQETGWKYIKSYGIIYSSGIPTLQSVTVNTPNIFIIGKKNNSKRM